MPAFIYHGNTGIDGFRHELWRVEIFTDQDCLERANLRAVPRIAGVVAGIRQRHRIARVMLAGRSDRNRFPVAERAALLMTIAARLPAVRGEPPVVEEPPSERELRRRLDVVGLGQRKRKSARQLPIESRVLGGRNGRDDAAARRGDDERRRGDQEAPFHHERNVEVCAVNGAVWP